MGAFLVSAQMKQGQVCSVEIVSEKGGLLRMKNPFKDKYELVSGDQSRLVDRNGRLEIMMTPGEELILSCIHK